MDQMDIDNLAFDMASAAVDVLNKKYPKLRMTEGDFDLVEKAFFRDQFLCHLTRKKHVRDYLDDVQDHMRVTYHSYEEANKE